MKAHTLFEPEVIDQIANAPRVSYISLLAHKAELQMFINQGHRSDHDIDPRRTIRYFQLLDVHYLSSRFRLKKAIKETELADLQANFLNYSADGR